MSRVLFVAGTFAILTCEPVTRPNSTGAPGGADAGFADGSSSTDVAEAATSVAAVNHALQFASAYVRVPDNNLLDLTSTWTLEAWVKPVDASTGADQDIISKWALAFTASYILQIDASGKLRLVTNNGVTQSIRLSNGTLGDNTWHHVAATFSHGTVKLYLNGALDKTVTGVLTPLVSTEPVAFGREGSFPGGTFNGSIDEIRIWKVVRSKSQIARSLTKRLLGSETGLVGYWRFDEGTGQLATDATGHGLNGRLGETTGVDAADPTWITNTVAPVY
ncbi:MAG: LamG domain-containing protein [Gemmatimonadales bacterium]